MGNCICNEDSSNCISGFALKFPHGKKGIFYCSESQSFKPIDNINDWIHSIYKDQVWDNWIIYNDEHKLISEAIIQHHRGHCKGILAWNNEYISWLCHSVPKFPNTFTATAFNEEINQRELIYGQSFQYIQIPYEHDKLIMISQQLMTMEAPIYIEKDHINFPIKKSITTNTIKLTESISHIAKSPNFHIDIYSECIANRYTYNWKIETWIRGHQIEKQHSNVYDVKNLQYKNFSYLQTQDHSKWAVSDDDYYFIGDLNRMTSQFKRGGGGFICKNKAIVNLLQELIQI